MVDQQLFLHQFIIKRSFGQDDLTPPRQSRTIQEIKRLDTTQKKKAQVEKHALFNSVASLSFSDRESSSSAETEVTRETSAERSLSVSELDPDSLVIQPSGCIWQMEELVATVYGSQLGSTKLKITDSQYTPARPPSESRRALTSSSRSRTSSVPTTSIPLS